MMIDFTSEEKATAFDLLATRYFDRNFGTLPKSNLDVLMFSIYLNHCVQSGEPTDDYTLSKELGISPTKIRSLKQNEALQLTVSRSDNWKEEFARYAKFARYDPAKQMVKMTIPEVVVLNELRHFVVQNGLYDEYQLNPRLFQCRLDVFVELCGLLSDANVTFDDRTLKELEAEALNDSDKSAIALIRADNWKEGLLKISKSTVKEVLPTLLKAIPFGGVAVELISALCKAISDA